MQYHKRYYAEGQESTNTKTQEEVAKLEEEESKTKSVETRKEENNMGPCLASRGKICFFIVVSVQTKRTFF